jgi:aminoglycoside/choline kinase family phosphotransferase
MLRVLTQSSIVRAREEPSIIRALHLSGLLLLNDLGGYAYKTAIIEEEREIVHTFCDALIEISK